MFIDETRTKNTKNSQNMRVKGINLTIVLIIKTFFGLLSICLFKHKMRKDNETENPKRFDPNPKKKKKKI